MNGKREQVLKSKTEREREREGAREREREREREKEATGQEPVEEYILSDRLAGSSATVPE